MSNNIQVSEQLQGAVQAPNGEIQYYTKIINKYNPYLQQSIIEEETGVRYQELEYNGQKFLISISDLKLAAELEDKTNIIRLLCLIDFIMNLLIGFTSYYPVTALYSILIFMISLTGFIAITTYNRSGLILYLFYQYLQTCSKIIILGFYIIATIIPQVLIDLDKKGFNLVMPIPANI